MLRRALLLLLALVALAPLASAHAVLQSATPGPNGHAEAGVTQIEIRFTEDVEREYTGADLYDVDGVSHAAGPAVFDESAHNVIHLPVEPLQDGIYAVKWQTLSVDSHTARGTFIFSVGNATLRYTPPAQAHDHEAHTWNDIYREGFARAVFYVGLFLVIGLPLFALVVDRERPPGRGLLGTGALFGLLGAGGAGLGLLLFAERTGIALGVALGTAAGTAFAWRGALLAAGAAVLLAAAFLPEARRRHAAALAVLLGAGALLATSLGSHAAAVKEGTALAVTMDALHLAMAAIWVGGVIGFLHVVLARTPQEVGRAIHRFSPIAVASVVLLLATGTYASARHMPCFSAEGGYGAACVGQVFTEGYVGLVALKVALLAPLVALGAYNKNVLGPRLKAGQGEPRYFRRVAQAEAVIMVAILGVAGVLASTPPPDAAVELGEQVGLPLTFENTTQATHVIVQVGPNPVTVGLQRLSIELHPLTPVPINKNATVAVKVQGPGQPEPEVFMEDPPLERLSTDSWVAEGGIFTEPGTWRLTVIVQRTDVREYAELAFDVHVVTPEAASGASAT